MEYHYKLIDAVTEPTNVDICYRNNGMTNFGFVRVNPYEEYHSVKLKSGKEIFLEDDELLRKSLQDATEKVTFTEAFEARLKEHNVIYQIVPPSCRCRKTPSIVFHNIEVFEV